MKENNSVILILNYNNYNLTIECVNNLIGIGCKEKIIIVDNNSPNKSYEVLMGKFGNNEKIDIIKTKYNGGYSYGNNYGIKYVKKKYNNTKYIVIMNPDIIIKNRDVIKNMIDIIHNNNEIIMSTALGFTNDKLIQASFGWKLPGFVEIIKSNLSFLKLFKNKQIQIPKLQNNNGYYMFNEVISGCFFAISLDYLESIEYLDENVFLYFEENILSNKIKSDGFKIAISINDVYYHNHISKDERLMKFKEKQRDYEIFSKSQEYYYKNILKMSLIKRILIKSTVLIHKFIEIPIISLIRRIK